MADYGQQLYGEHLMEFPEPAPAARRGSRSGPEGGARQAVKQVPAETNPATTARVSRAGRAKKHMAGSAIRLDGA
jgi:hypothetical protein